MPEEAMRKRLVLANLGPMFHKKNLRPPTVLGGLLPAAAKEAPAEVAAPRLRTDSRLRWTAAPGFLVRLENEDEQDRQGLVRRLHGAGFLPNMRDVELEGSGSTFNHSEDSDHSLPKTLGPHDSPPRRVPVLMIQ